MAANRKQRRSKRLHLTFDKEKASREISGWPFFIGNTDQSVSQTNQPQCKNILAKPEIAWNTEIGKTTDIVKSQRGASQSA